MSKRILVVEDQPDNRQIILAPTDYSEVENGEEALAAIAKQRPDLIFMDIQLPVMDGYEATCRSELILLCDRSRSLRSPPMRLAGRKRKPVPQAAMITCQNPSARANCWRKFEISCNDSGRPNAILQR